MEEYATSWITLFLNHGINFENCHDFLEKKNDVLNCINAKH